jgi:hypothetical protein
MLDQNPIWVLMKNHVQTSLLQQIASDPIIQQAYDWLCQRRENASDQADVWHLRWHWERLRPQLQADLRLLQGYMQRTVYDGVYETKTLGISLGCSLSPLMGATVSQAVGRPHARAGVVLCPLYG